MVLSSRREIGERKERKKSQKFALGVRMKLPTFHYRVEAVKVIGNKEQKAASACVNGT
jgi:hypothetical protein